MRCRSLRMGSHGNVRSLLDITTAEATGTITAPPSTTNVSNLTIRIQDATGDEDDGWLDFRVRLSQEYDDYVCYDFETISGGTATEGRDYSKRPKVGQWMQIGKRVDKPFVRIIDDSVNDNGETVKVKISNAHLCDDASQTVSITRAEATGTITNSDPMPRAWLARFGRTVADQVIDAVDGRLGAARRPGVEATLAGRSIAGAPEGDEPQQSMAEDAASRVRLEAMSNWLRGDTGESRAGLSGSPAVLERDLLVGTAFSMSGMAKDGGSVTLWGRGAIASFDGRETSLAVDGEVANVMLGADWSGGALTAGLMLSHARGSGSYRGESDGKVESTLTGIYPYGRYAASERVTVWGVAGLRRRQSYAEAGGRCGDRDRHGPHDGCRRAARRGDEGAEERRPRAYGQVGRHGGAHDLGRGAGARGGDGRGDPAAAWAGGQLARHHGWRWRVRAAPGDRRASWALTQQRYVKYHKGY